MSLRYVYYYLLVIAVVAVDQFSKYLVKTYLAPSELAPGGAITVIPGVFEITYVGNTGAAFSMLQGQRLILAVVAVIVITALLVFIFLRRDKDKAILLIAAALIAGGGTGNLIDRIRLGAVVDYLAFWSFPVFNAADIAVCVGCGLTILHFILLEFKSSKDI